MISASAHRRPWLGWAAVLAVCALTLGGLPVAPPAGATLPVRCYPAIPMAGDNDSHSVVLGSDGTAWAAGDNVYGQLGSSGSRTSTPRQVANLSGLTALASQGQTSLALRVDGTVWGWGYNGDGQLGDGTTTHRSSPVQASGLTDVIAIATGGVGWGHSLAVKSDGTVWAWGDNRYGQLGNDTMSRTTVPVQVPGLTGVTAVSAGGAHSLALTSEGKVWAWGNNTYGQLGTGNYQSSPKPVQVSALSSLTAISAGDWHSLALKSDGKAWGWGYNREGEVGTGSYTWDEPNPKEVINLSGVTGIAGSGRTSYALLSSGSVYAWGSGWAGRLGNGQLDTTTHTPVQVSNLSGVKAIAEGPLALRSDGTLWSWGWNEYGQLGDGATKTRAAPVQVNNVTQSVPATPADLAAAGGEQLAYLTYKPPPSVVTQYVVTPYVWGVAQPQVPAGTRDSFAVRNLTQGTTYSFTVAAQNCLGTSDETPRSERVVPTGVQLSETGFKIEGTELTDRMTLKVNAFNGNLALHTADLRISGTGLDLAITRSFNNRSSDTSSPWGARWAASVGKVGLTFLSGGSIMYNGPGGAQLGFAKRDDGTYASPPGVNATLSFDDGGTPSDTADDRYVLKENATYERLTFDATTGKLLEAKDRNANAITYAYGGPGGTLSQITDTQGRVTTLSYNTDGRVEKITDPASRIHAYAYDGSGNLTSHTDPAGGISQFTYDGQGNLTRITTPAGRRVDIAYDASRRVTSLVWPLHADSPTTTFAYSIPSPLEHRTVVTDPNGAKTTYSFDPVGRTTAVTDALGAAASLDYTSRSNLRRYTAARGGQTSFGYTSVHALNSVRAPTGATDTLAYEDSRHPHLPTRITDPQGNHTSLAYDLAGNLVSQENQLPSENRVSLDYNPDGTVAEVTDPRGGATAFTYDAQGNQTKTTPPSPLGEWSVTYDAVSRVTSLTDGEGQQTDFAYDPLDRVTKIVYADDTEVTYAYDPDGHLLQMTDPTGTVTVTYDAMGRLASRGTPDGAETVTYTYDKGGNLRRIWVDWQAPGCDSLWELCSSDPTYEVAYTYNAVNLPVTAWANNREVAFTYDADYNRTSVSYPNGVTQRPSPTTRRGASVAWPSFETARPFAASTTPTSGVGPTRRCASR